MSRPGVVWLFSPALDLLAFLAPALVSLGLCAGLWATGGLDRPLGPMGWLLAVVLVDVAHVYATAYRVYADPAELRRRPLLYLAVPVGCYLFGVLSYAVSELTFWRVLAYLAVLHFVRQQVGWVALSGRRDGAVPPPWRRVDRLLDQGAVYAGTLYPLLYWHVHLPRRFHWFVPGDFVALCPHWVLPLCRPLWLAAGLLWAARQLHRALSGQGWNAAKLLVVSGTFTTWYVGIVALDSDVAFTLTNVLSHGVPYLLVVWRYEVRRTGRAEGLREGQRRLVALSLLVFYAPLAAAALLEEGIWDRLVWHDHAMLFPLPACQVGAGVLLWLAPLLALPQSTHYLLDGWIWRSRGNPGLGQHLGI